MSSLQRPWRGVMGEPRPSGRVRADRCGRRGAGGVLSERSTRCPASWTRRSRSCVVVDGDEPASSPNRSESTTLTGWMSRGEWRSKLPLHSRERAASNGSASIESSPAIPTVTLQLSNRTLLLFPTCCFEGGLYLCTFLKYPTSCFGRWS